MGLELVGKLLESHLEHSIVVWESLLTVLFIFRILRLRAASCWVWGDEQSGFHLRYQAARCQNRPQTLRHPPG
ncbi:gap junction alpha-3 protein-like protein [Lates japonicus]|uniref:Gap junction alpha-3 protein-like protein n=1 Tax=Lates japonicus TaxID=270547 RepID=A0AAD3M4W1_LATJO|nr:gap junction alpha-3 protein-like protein [Lates japonicus]